MTVATSLRGIWVRPLGPWTLMRRFSNCLRVLSELGCEPDHDREVSITAGFIDVAGGIAADRYLDGRIDVAGGKAIARGAGAIDVNLYRRLSERGENREIGNARHGGELGLYLVRRVERVC